MLALGGGLVKEWVLDALFRPRLGVSHSGGEMISGNQIAFDQVARRGS